MSLSMPNIWRTETFMSGKARTFLQLRQSLLLRGFGTPEA